MRCAGLDIGVHRSDRRSRGLSEPFAPGKDTLAIYNFMFPRAPDEGLCPSCTQFLDSCDGAAGTSPNA